MAGFMLMLHEDPATFAPMSPEDMQRIIEEYSAWSDKMRKIGALRGGHKLEDGAGRVIRAGVVTDGPYTEAKEVIGGFFEIEAADYDAAVAIARDCPHARYGAVEVRRIDLVG